MAGARLGGVRLGEVGRGCGLGFSGFVGECCVGFLPWVRLLLGHPEA